MIFGRYRAALAIAAVVAFNISLNTKKDNASLLALADVEALASIEGPEITVLCNSGEGRCWAIDRITPLGRCYCYFSGYQKDLCYFYVR